jgi:hypothetical protein
MHLNKEKNIIFVTIVRHSIVHLSFCMLCYPCNRLWMRYYKCYKPNVHPYNVTKPKHVTTSVTDPMCVITSVINQMCIPTMQQSLSMLLQV